MEKEVWRYENKDGIGPYNGFNPGDTDTLLELKLHHSDDLIGHPEPNYPAQWAYGTWRSGTLTHKKLLYWFKGYHAVLKQQGYRIVQCKVRSHTPPDKWGQVAFHLNDLISKELVDE